MEHFHKKSCVDHARRAYGRERYTRISSNIVTKFTVTILLYSILYI